MMATYGLHTPVTGVIIYKKDLDCGRCSNVHASSVSKVHVTDQPRFCENLCMCRRDGLVSTIFVSVRLNDTYRRDSSIEFGLECADELSYCTFR